MLGDERSGGARVDEWPCVPTNRKSSLWQFHARAGGLEVGIVEAILVE